MAADWTALYNNGGASVSLSDTSPKSTVTTLYVNSNIVNGGQITFSALSSQVLVDGDTFVAFFNNNQNIAVGIYSTTNLTVSGVRFNKSGIITSQGYDNCTVWRGNIIGVEFIKEIFIDSATVPTTPTGGSYNFSQNVLTPPIWMGFRTHYTESSYRKQSLRFLWSIIGHYAHDKLDLADSVWRIRWIRRWDYFWNGCSYGRHWGRWPSLPVTKRQWQCCSLIYTFGTFAGHKQMGFRIEYSFFT